MIRDYARKKIAPRDFALERSSIDREDTVMILALLKAGCLAIYALALAGAAGLLSGAAATIFAFVAMALLGVHLLELVFVFDRVRLYRGPLAASVLLTLLFGLLHWKPLSDARSAPTA